MHSVSLHLRLKNASVSYSSDQVSSAINMECSPTDSTGALEIGEKHVFASRSNRPFPPQAAIMLSFHPGGPKEQADSRSGREDKSVRIQNWRSEVRAFNEGGGAV